MLKVSFPATKIAAVSLFAAAKDIRYYLNGVFFEVNGNETRVAATDGHTLAVAREMGYNTDQFNVIVPIDTVALILKTKPVTVEITENAGAWSVNGLPFQPVIGNFPAYRRVIPATTNGEAANFNPEYLMRCSKAGKLLKLKNATPIMHQNGELDATLVRFNEDSSFIAVIMPMRPIPKSVVDNGMPTWGNT